jgi:hypothetical protein
MAMTNCFDNYERINTQLLRDKHNLLEGYITEYFFEKQFLKEKYTDGWWVAFYNNTKIFFILKDALNPLDHEIINKISYRYDCWQVYLINSTFVFASSSFDGVVYTTDQFIKKYDLHQIRTPLIANSDLRDEQRQNEAIQFFSDKKIEKIVISRYFANNFLTCFFTAITNIDFFVKTGSKINAIEVKYKFESKNGYFGLSMSERSVFKDLSELGLSIYYFILYNHMHEKNGILTFINHENKKWIYRNITHIDRFRIAKSYAPYKTSIDGNTLHQYIEISYNKNAWKSIDFDKPSRLLTMLKR